MRIIESELEFNLPIRNPATGRPSRRFRFAGKLDRIVQLDDKRLAVAETKTCGDDLSPDSDFWRRLRMDQQISGYYIAAQDLGHDVATVVYDVIRKPTIRLRQKETTAEYGVRLLGDISERPAFYFARKEIPRLADDLAEFREELWQQQQHLGACQTHGRWFRNTSACLHPWRCEFFDLCSNGSFPLGAEVPPGFRRCHKRNEELSQEDNGDTLTHSSMTCAKSCLRRYYYRYVAQIKPDRDDEKLRIGSMVHHALDILARFDIGMACDAIRENYVQNAPKWAYADPAILLKWQTEEQKVLNLVAGYHWYWNDEGKGTTDAAPEESPERATAG